MKNSIVQFKLAAEINEKKEQIAQAKAWQPVTEILSKANEYIVNLIWHFWEDLAVKRTEPKIWQKRDRHGNSYWQVYDPITNYSSCFGSEQEVRIWLEERYYRLDQKRLAP